MEESNSVVMQLHVSDTHSQSKILPLNMDDKLDEPSLQLDSKGHFEEADLSGVQGESMQMALDDV